MSTLIQSDKSISGDLSRAKVVSRKKGHRDLDLKLGIHPIRKDLNVLKDDNAVKNAVKNLLITKGSFGMALFHEEDMPVDLPAENSREAFDVTGAGDTVLATVVAAALVAPLVVHTSNCGVDFPTTWRFAFVLMFFFLNLAIWL